VGSFAALPKPKKLDLADRRSCGSEVNWSMRGVAECFAFLHQVKLLSLGIPVKPAPQFEGVDRDVRFFHVSSPRTEYPIQSGDTLRLPCVDPHRYRSHRRNWELVEVGTSPNRHH
jgi:hypothetical protein